MSHHSSIVRLLCCLRLVSRQFNQTITAAATVTAAAAHPRHHGPSSFFVRADGKGAFALDREGGMPSDELDLFWSLCLRNLVTFSVKDDEQNPYATKVVGKGDLTAFVNAREVHCHGDTVLPTSTKKLFLCEGNAGPQEVLDSLDEYHGPASHISGRMAQTLKSVCITDALTTPLDALETLHVPSVHVVCKPKHLIATDQWSDRAELDLSKVETLSVDHALLEMIIGGNTIEGSTMLMQLSDLDARLPFGIRMDKVRNLHFRLDNVVFNDEQDMSPYQRTCCSMYRMIASLRGTITLLQNQDYDTVSFLTSQDRPVVLNLAHFARVKGLLDIQTPHGITVSSVEDKQYYEFLSGVDRLRLCVFHQELVKNKRLMDILAAHRNIILRVVFDDGSVDVFRKFDSCFFVDGGEKIFG